MDQLSLPTLAPTRTPIPTYNFMDLGIVISQIVVFECTNKRKGVSTYKTITGSRYTLFLYIFEVALN